MTKADGITKWMKDYVKKAGVKGIVLGLSGGVDSAVVAALAKRACGKNVLCISMPCEDKPGDDVLSSMDAGLVADHFKLKLITVDLTDTYKTLLEAMVPADVGSKLARANIKPRLRMTTLYYYANERNYLVSGTGNKSEHKLGYFTKYGDGGSDIEPIMDLWKSEVYILAKGLKVPNEIIDKEPSAGLWDGQTDEGEMGVNYAEIEYFLEGNRIEPEKESKIEEMMRKAEHKNASIPVCRFIRTRRS